MADRDNGFSYLKFLPLILFIVGSIIAAVRLEGRVTVHDQMFIERKTQEEQRWENVREQLQDIKVKLNAIDKKLDDKKDKFGPFR